ncbi:MAG: peptidylprolyl isomerase [Planctomycetes bacterium]|nr:peptidylprolyl isomerase [Planctomycetota bacterium]
MKPHRLAALALAAFASACGTTEDPVKDPAPTEYRRPPELAEIRDLEDRRVYDQTLYRHLKHADPVVRRRALVALGRVGHPSTVPQVAAALEDPDRTIIEEAAFALGLIGSPEAFDHLQPLLDSREPDLRAVALEAVGRLGEPRFAPYATAKVKDGSSAVRREVATALMRMNEKATSEEAQARMKEAVASLRPLLRDPDAAVRWRTAYALARMDASPLADALETGATDPDPLMRAFSARALGKVKEQPAATFVRLSRDADERVVYEAVNALASRDGEEVIAALNEAAMRGEHHSVARAVEILGEKKQAEAAVFKAARRHPDATVRAAAVVASARTRMRDDFEEVKKALADAHVLVRRAAVRALVVIGGDGARRELAAVFDGTDRRMQAAVLEAYEGDPKMAAERRLELDVLLRAGLRADDIAVRGTAVGLLEGRTEPEWENPLIEAYGRSSGREMYEIREMILKQLEAMKAGAGVAEEGLKDAEYAVRAQAAKTLAAATGRAVAVPEPPVEAREAGRVDEFVSDPVVKLETTCGDIRIRLFPEAAPGHVTSFVRLVKKGFFDGKTWHRVVPNFVIQGGDPRGDGWGDAGFTLRDEISRLRFEAGTVGMAKAGKDTGSCQLFITHVPTPHLDGRYTIFGRVVEGMDVVRTIEVGDTIVKASLDR